MTVEDSAIGLAALTRFVRAFRALEMLGPAIAATKS
jgi:hypothetical protein